MRSRRGAPGGEGGSEDAGVIDFTAAVEDVDPRDVRVLVDPRDTRVASRNRDVGGAWNQDPGLVALEAPVLATDGKPLFGYTKVANAIANIPTVVVRGEYVFASTGYNDGVPYTYQSQQCDYQYGAPVTTCFDSAAP